MSVGAILIHAISLHVRALRRRTLAASNAVFSMAVPQCRRALALGYLILGTLLVQSARAEGEAKVASPSAARTPPAATPAATSQKKDTETSPDDKTKTESTKQGTTQTEPAVPKALAGSAFDPCSTSVLHPSALHCPLRAALLHQKFGVMEHGNVAEFDRACHELDLAVADIHDHPADEMQRAEWQLHHIKREVSGLRRAAERTLFGQYPLIRASGVDTGDDEDLQVHSHVLPGEALRRAVRGALSQLVKSASSDPLHVVVLVTGDDDPDRAAFAELVDAEARHAFLGIANFQLYPGTLRYMLGPVPDWDAPDPAFDPICRQFLARIAPAKQQRSVMLVLVRGITDASGDRNWVQAQQRTFYASTLETAKDKPADLENDKVRISETLTHDRSRLNLPILGGMGLLFCVALAAHAALSWWLAHPLKGWLRWLAVPAAGFSIGVLLTPLIMLVLGRWLPHPESQALKSAWWPCMAGGLTLILPAGVFRLAAGAAGRSFPSLSCHGRWGTVFVPVALGTCAAWVRPACYALGADSLHLIVSLSVTAGLLAFCFGRAIDLADRFPFAVAPVAIVLALVCGAGAYRGAPVMLWSVALCAALTTTVDSILGARRALSAVPDDESPDSAAAPPANRPQTVEQLVLAVSSPRYLPPAGFSSWVQTLLGNGLQHCTWIGLAGPSAAGKSAAAAHLISLLNSAGNEVQVLSGHCTENSPPYQAIREAFASLGLPGGLVAASPQGGEVNSLFERLADELIPYWDFFSGNADDSGEETSQRDLLGAIANIVHALSSRQTLALFLDDIQWLDEGSLAVLKHLRDSFPPGDDARLLVILASRDAQTLERLELGDSIYTFTSPTTADQVRILEQSLGIEKHTAGHLIGALGAMSQEDAGMFWVLRAVREAALDGAFVNGPRGFTLRKRYLTRQRLPMPTEMRTKLEESLRGAGPHQPVLECAALLGEQFRVDDLAECLGLDRLTLLQVLRHLDRDLQLVRDVPADPECYMFSSTFLYETVREELGDGGTRSRKAQPTKLASEYHARIARTLEGRTPRTRALSYRIGQHYFQAGAAHAASAADFCLAAARAARKEHAFKNARRYIAMAEQAARQAGKTLDLDDERRRIDNAEQQTQASSQPGSCDAQTNATVRKGAEKPAEKSASTAKTSAREPAHAAGE